MSKTNELSLKGCAILGVVGVIVIGGLMLFLSTENFSNGERIGYITKFSSKGRFWKSWEGELNLTQTGMNTSSLYEFSIDNDNEDPKVVALIDSAVNNGWKVKLKYHEVRVKNFFDNRGETNHFITGIDILDKSNANPFAGDRNGKIIDTVFVVIDKSQLGK